MGTNLRVRIGGRAALLALLGFLTLGVAGVTPAQAGNEFEDGFEDQLGRLVATQVFGAAHFVLTGGHGYHGGVHYGPPPVYRPARHSRHRDRYDGYRAYRPERRHHHRAHARHHDDCDHRGDRHDRRWKRKHHRRH